MGVNRRRMSLREGQIFVDGVKIVDAAKFEAYMTPEVHESRALKERGMSRRYLGYDITGNMTEYRSTPWIRKIIDKYNRTGETPEFTVTAIQDDENSDYYAENGNSSVTLSGVVFTGDLPLASLDSEGDLVQDEIEFGAKYLS